MDTTFKRKLAHYLDAGFPILYIHSFEEEKIDAALMSVAGGRNLVEWNGANGIVDFKTKVSQSEQPLSSALAVYEDPSFFDNTILVLKDFPPYLEEPEVVSKLKNLARKISTVDGLDACIVMVSTILKIPKELEKYITIMATDYLTEDEIKAVIINFIARQNANSIDTDLMEKMTSALKGLSELDINSILALAYADDGVITENDLQLVFEQKRQMIQKAGILEMVPLKEGIEDIGGLEVLKEWLYKKERVFKNLKQAQAFGVDTPKGVLIVGVPGCGKSLTAKAAAQLFNVPLLKLDMGRLMGKYVGESESNMRKAIELAEAVSPCVLWVDELEKAFAGVGSFGGGSEVTTRLLGNFLTWMQEKKSPAFVVATANDIKNLPTELIRKGRFDEIFYVNLPNSSERKSIFEIHINKRRPSDSANVDIPALVAKTDGFSGADIEGVVKDGVEAAFAGGREAVTTADFLASISNTNSLYQLMREQIDKLKKDYETRKFKNASR